MSCSRCFILKPDREWASLPIYLLDEATAARVRTGAIDCGHPAFATLPER